MSTVKMTIHQGLSELKIGKARIDNEIRNGSFVFANKASNKKIQGKTIEETSKNIKSLADSVDALENRLGLIKRAIVKSNASAKVVIGEKDYTVAEAIETKSSIVIKKFILAKMEQDWGRAQSKVNLENEQLENRFQAFVKDALGNDLKAEELQAQRDLYYKVNGYEFINPLDIAKKIETLRNEIEAFEGEVDYKLSESNATTFIEV